jgi:hypothetical protein
VVSGGVVEAGGGGLLADASLLPPLPPPPQAANNAATASPISEFLYTLIFLFDENIAGEDCAESYEPKTCTRSVAIARRH